MEFYLTPLAQIFCNNFIDNIIEKIDYAIQIGFIPWYAGKIKSYDLCQHLDVPVFLIMEDDMGKEFPLDMWGMVVNRKFNPEQKAASVINRPWFIDIPNLIKPAREFQGKYKESALNILDNIKVPKEIISFNPKDINNLIEILKSHRSSDNRYCDRYPYYDQYDSNNQNSPRPEIFWTTNWLGVYYNSDNASRCIFIRVEKIMGYSLLRHPEGVTSVILHELGHALMDPMASVNLKFAAPYYNQYADFIKYTLEESLANVIAFRSLQTKNNNTPKAILNDIAEFMKSHQRFPYSLGIRISGAKTDRDTNLESYLRYWYGSKTGALIYDVGEWLRLLNCKIDFDKNDLKQQIVALWPYSAKKNSGVPIYMPIYDRIYYFYDGLARVMIDGLWGYINKKGKLVIAADFVNAEDFSDGFAAIKIDGKWGYINKKGNLVINTKFDKAKSFCNGKAEVNLKGEKYYIDKKGNPIDDKNGNTDKGMAHIISWKNNDANRFSGELIPDNKNGQFGFVDKTGNYVVPPVFSRVRLVDYDDEIIAVELNSKWGIINKNGKYLN